MANFVKWCTKSGGAICFPPLNGRKSEMNPSLTHTRASIIVWLRWHRPQNKMSLFLHFLATHWILHILHYMPSFCVTRCIYVALFLKFGFASDMGYEKAHTLSIQLCSHAILPFILSIIKQRSDTIVTVVFHYRRFVVVAVVVFTWPDMYSYCCIWISCAINILISWKFPRHTHLHRIYLIQNR